MSHSDASTAHRVTVDDDSATLREDERTVILLLAYVHLRHGAPHKAETLYAAMHVLDARDNMAAKGLAYTRLELGKPQAALTVLDGIAGPGEPSAVVQLLRARAFVQMERLDDAQVAMRAFGAARAGAASSPAPAVAPRRATLS